MEAGPTLCHARAAGAPRHPGQSSPQAQDAQEAREQCLQLRPREASRSQGRCRCLMFIKRRMIVTENAPLLNQKTLKKSREQ